MTVSLPRETLSQAAKCGETKLIARTDPRRPPERGERVTLRPRSAEAHVFDPQSGDRLGS